LRPISIKAKFKEKLPSVFFILSRVKQGLLSILIEIQKKYLPAKLEKYYGDSVETKEIISFLKSNPVEMIPYFFRNEYKNREINIRINTKEDLYVVELDGSDIYFPKEMSTEYIIDSVRVALMEQDERSPHKYLPTKNIHLQGEVAVLCGASDGIYALQIINHFKKIYLFEANPSWIKPIKKTLSSYLHKIEIVPYYVSDEDDVNSITLDSFFKDKNETVSYIQADIENAELKMLRGANQLLERSERLTLALCCYHTANQESDLTSFLQEKHYKIQPSNGYLLMWMDFPLKAPYLRRGVLYATRSVE
jgi:hypothetical protein